MTTLQTLFTGKNQIHFPEIPSTNEYALNLISKTNPPEGTCIIADFQSEGRGQIGSRWHSAPGKNLLITYIFHPKWLDIRYQFYLNIISSLAVSDLVQHYGVTSSIKWPNDIFVGNKKIAGILNQNILKGNTIKGTAMGIGLNVNETDFPIELEYSTSLAKFNGQEYNIFEVMHRLSEYLEHYYLQLKAGEMTSLNDKYHQRLYLRNIEAPFELPDGKRFKGRILEVDKDGRLVILHDTGAMFSYAFKEVKYLNQRLF